MLRLSVQGLAERLLVTKGGGVILLLVKRGVSNGMKKRVFFISLLLMPTLVFPNTNEPTHKESVPIRYGWDTFYSGSDKVYLDVSAATPFFAQGSVIFNTTMPNDGSVHYFTDNRGFEWGPTGIYQRRNGETAQLVTLQNAKIPADVHISTDGKILYFTDYGDNPSRVYTTVLQSGQWQTPIVETRLPAGSGYLTSTDQGTIYFVNAGDIFRLQGGEIDKLPGAINTAVGEHDPFIAQDESFLIFVRQDADGDSNMYLSVKSGEGWTTAEKLPSPFNDTKVDGSPYVTPDKRYLFWSSNRGGDILKTWQAPILAYFQAKGIVTK